MKIEPINRTTISEQVFEQMKQQILKGEWKPGQKLPSENDLASSFQVSRITVRQALQKLTVLGLVETRFGEGSFIRSGSLAPMMNRMVPLAYLGDFDIVEVLEYRQMVEVETAGFAAEKATPEDIASLQENYGQMKKAIGNVREFSKIDLDFHFLIANSTHNELAISTDYILRDILSTAMDGIVTTLGHEIGIRYHGMLLDAIRAHDVERAKDLMREHISQTLKAMRTGR